MTQVAAVDLDQALSEAFAERMLDVLNSGALALALRRRYVGVCVKPQCRTPHTEHRLSKGARQSLIIIEQIANP
jgi:hypothetical protein